VAARRDGAYDRRTVPRASTIQLTLAAVAALATACSLLTPLDGLTGGAETDASVAIEGGSVDMGAPPDGAEVDAALDAPRGPRAWRKAATTGPVRRHSGRSAYDAARSRVVLYGGQEGGAYLGDTWEWDGATWAQAAVLSGPPERRGMGMTYDERRRAVIVFSGAGHPGELWEHTGTLQWTLRPSVGARPSTDHAHAIAYDARRGVTVLFGGYDTKSLAGTWEWDGDRWTEKSPPASPSPRRGHALVYDAARGRVVLFGGRLDGGASDETWEYDGSTWTLRSPANKPPARFGVCGAYDAARRVVTIVGGLDSALMNDVWEWNGDAWAQVAQTPVARRSCSLSYDAARDALVLFGGTVSAPGPTRTADGDTWVFE
jgi:hypothetical protein